MRRFGLNLGLILTLASYIFDFLELIFGFWFEFHVDEISTLKSTEIHIGSLVKTKLDYATSKTFQRNFRRDQHRIELKNMSNQRFETQKYVRSALSSTENYVTSTLGNAKLSKINA